MKRIGMGIVGAGFVGPHHVDAVRRLGYVDIVAVAGSSEESGQQKARLVGARTGYGSYQALLDDPDVDVVHVATPNHLHYEISSAALATGKHVVSDKPLAASAAEARRLVDQQQQSGLVGAVTFNYRGNPLVQHARLAVAGGEIGTPTFLHGYYLQDFLLHATDYSWRLDADKAGGTSAVGDIGSHWCDLAQHISGLTITQVLADITTVVPRRVKPRGSRVAFETGHESETGTTVDIQVEDLASVLVRFSNGAKGSFSVGQVCPGHKNDLSLEVCGANAALRWRQEQQNELWIGHRERANEILQKDPSLLPDPVRRYAHLPGGHQEAWADAFCNVMRDIYGYIASDRSAPPGPAFASFLDGYRANCIVEAILASARGGGVWTAVPY